MSTKQGGASLALSKADTATPLAREQEAVAPVAHQDPTEGGSYTRDPDTGALVKNEPAPEDKPSQE